MPSTTPPSSGRLQFIDLLRGWAVIVMIETHVVNATITDAIAGTQPFLYLKFLNGLVAPSFLFASGLAYAVTTRRKLASYLTPGPPLFKQLRRILFLFCIGYLLHVPKFQLHALLNDVTPAEWLNFFQVDVLQCIAISLLFMQVLLFVVRTERRMYTTLALVTVLLIGVTPFMWGTDFLRFMPAVFAGYLNGIHGSLFPVFPWAGFLFAGAITGYLFAQARDAAAATPPAGPGTGGIMVRSMGAGVAAAVLAFAIEPVASSWYPTYDFWRYSPSYVFIRLGIVFVLCGVMFFYERLRGVSPVSPVALMGRESLLVYTAHLFAIYGTFGDFTFHRAAGQNFGYIEAIAVSLGLILAMYALAVLWDRVRKRPPWVKRSIQTIVALLVLALFLFGPGS